MQFNDTINGQGIVQDAYFMVNADATSYPITDVTRSANYALDRVVSLILGADYRWQFDSTNSTDLPVGETDIISGQQDYSFNDEYLVIKSLEIQNSSGAWTKLLPIDNNLDGVDGTYVDQGLSSFQTTSGAPQYYDKMGQSVLLYPTPNYNRRLLQEGAAGLRAYFQRKIDYFTVSDTTKEPGFAKHLHKYIALCIAHDYAIAKQLWDKALKIEQQMEFYEGNKAKGGRNEGEIAKFYAYREREVRRRLTVRQESNK